MDADADAGSVTMAFAQSLVDHSDLPIACALCQRFLSSDYGTGDLESIRICGDCKFLFLEDIENQSQDTERGRTSRVRQTRYNSSESVDNIFSQQFASIVNLARQNHPTAFEHENQSSDNGDAVATRVIQRPSSRTTPSGSRRWRRGLSDTDSDGGYDSIYGESESNMSFGRYRHFHGGSDAMSLSAYGGDSDASVDGITFLDNDMFIRPDGGSDLDSDTDIDPMHAGLSLWNSDDEEDEWEEVDTEENTPSRNNNPVGGWHRRVGSSEFEGTIQLRIGERTEAPFTNIFASLDESNEPRYVGNSGDYLDGRGFEELLERLAETDSSRRGGPPAAESFVKSLDPIVIPVEEQEDDLGSCAICKECFYVGSVVNKLPCLHLYHPMCIVPWLSARNSCPLCRYELPTDEMEYERRKHINSGVQQQEEVNEDSSSESASDDDVEEEGEADEVVNDRERRGRGGRWLFVAAPIVSLVGIALVLWLGGNPSTTETRGGGQQPLPPNQRRENHRGRSWWPF